jgi:predicted O-linked N-acetylglucosamine transferase (SPINDLY family)
MAKPSVERALGLLEEGRLAEAQGVLAKLLKNAPNDPTVLQLMGVVASERGQHGQAIAYLERAVRLAAGALGPRLNLGKALHGAGRVDAAEAVLAQAVQLGPQVADAHLAHGAALADLGRRREAADRFAEAIRLRPALAKAHLNRAVVLYRLGEQEAALEAWEEYLRLQPNSPAGLFGRAMCQQHLCQWDGYEERLATLAALEGGGASVPGAAFFSLLVWDDPKLHRQCAELALGKAARSAPASPARPAGRASRIRLAYVSADFRGRHPVGNLTVGVFEQHDRERFETFGVSLSADDGSELRRRTRDAFDTFLDVHAESAEAITRLLREHRIDIAVDLMGHTLAARPGIFAARTAPVQVSYLGFPGTLAIPAVDYMVVDAFVATDALRRTSTEKLVILPDCYWCNDDKREPVIAGDGPARAEHGLPDGAFVFASFNQLRKITPEVFDVWMRILAQVEGSVLWLLATPEKPAAERAAANLKAEAARRGVHPGRLVFAERTTAERHLARVALADLHLDTFPYTSHTTANDALWAGRPIVTRPGAGFASRVCGSLLATMGLSDLIVASWQDYEALAVALAHDPTKLGAIRTRVAAARATSPLFDTARFCRNLERAYQAMFELAAAGKPAAEIDLRGGG